MIQTFLQRVQDAAKHQPLLNLQDKSLQSDIIKMTEGAFSGDEASCSDFHHLLASLNKLRLSRHVSHTPQSDVMLESLCTYMEVNWIQRERTQIEKMLLQMPHSPDGFVGWFEQLQQTGPGQNHPLFLYLAERANREEYRYFLQQEMATEAGFDDLVSLTQVGTSPQVKMELAANYWDEMGDGKMEDMHTLQLRRMISSFNLDWEDNYQDVHWAPLALSNLMIAFAGKRSFFNQSIGALGVIELTAPGRCIKVKDGLKRIGLASQEYHYYTLHSVLDVHHWEGWKTNVIYPLIQETPQNMLKIAEGALMRLLAGARCFEVYSRQLGLKKQSKAMPQTEEAKSHAGRAMSRSAV